MRAVVITGAGRGFCVGQDLREHQELLAAHDPSPLHTVVEHYNPIVTALVEMPKPVVAAVNGMAAGAGAGIAFAADFRIASQSAGFLIAFANVGLSLDTGTSWTLPRLVGYARAMALALLADPISADAALEMGLVNAVVEPDRVLAAATEIAARLATGPTAAYAAIKDFAAVRRHQHAGGRARQGSRAATTCRSDRGPPHRRGCFRRQTEARVRRALASCHPVREPAADDVIVHDPGRLHEGIGGGRADEPESPAA